MEYLDFLQEWLIGSPVYSRYLAHMPAPFNNGFFDTMILFVALLYGLYRIMDAFWMVHRHRAIRKRQLELQEQMDRKPLSEPQPVTQTVQVVNCGEALAIRRLLSLYEEIRMELENVRYEKDAETFRIRAMIEDRESKLSEAEDPEVYEKISEELAKLRKALEDAEKEKEAEVGRLTEQLRQANDDICAIRSDRDRRITLLEEELDHARKEAKELAGQSDGYDQKIADLEEQLRDMKRSAMNYDSERERLEGEIAAYKERISEFESREEAIDVSAKEAYANMQHTLESLQTDLETAKQKAAVFEAESRIATERLYAQLEQSMRDREALERQARENAETIAQLSFQLFEAKRDRNAVAMEQRMENLEMLEDSEEAGGLVSNDVHESTVFSGWANARSAEKKRMAPVSDTPLPKIELSGDVTDFDRLMDQLVSSNQKEQEFKDQERIRKEQAKNNVSSLEQKLFIEAKPDTFAVKAEKMASNPALERQKEKALKQKQKEEDARASGKKGIFGFMHKSKGAEADG